MVLLKLKNSIKFFSYVFIIVLTIKNKACAQEIEFKKSSIKTGIAIGINEGQRETGNGLLYSIGWQKSLGEKERARINPNLMIGGFSPVLITDTRDQFYRITSLGLNIHYDLIKYNAISIVTTA